MHWEQLPHWLELASESRRNELLRDCEQHRLLKRIRVKRPNLNRLSYQLGSMLVNLGARLQNRQAL